MTSPNIVELARRAKKGDKGAFEELCLEKQQQIFFSAFTMLGNHHDAEDVAQETILSMFRNISRLKNPEAIEAWIYRIVRSRVSTLLAKRTKYREEVNIDDEDVHFDIAEENRDFLPEAFAEDKDASDRIYEIVRALPEKKREVIMMFYYDDLSYKEIAEITKSSIKTVSSNMSKARVMIKEKLNSENIAKAAVAASGGSSSVLGEILRQQANVHATPEMMAALQESWLPAVKESKSMPGKSALGAKVVVVAVAGVMLVSGGIFSAVYFGGNGQAEETVTNSLVATDILKDRDIVFTGGDCECGHVNPSGAEVGNLKDGDGEATWEIRNADGGDLIASGAGTDAGGIITEMVSADKVGDYTVFFKLQDADGNSINLDRAFKIGVPPDGAL
ncbi:MAG: sigma-70 family RNA polymerase sigma factor [Clostridiales Family XIII bacterium]|jgi:RNA polymerase sigma-70 factor (ECF subfamily)|nr:sigma-70 family RNA polymerase sigma factor [Clostridiales Family XIII bacterium]